MSKTLVKILLKRYLPKIHSHQVAAQEKEEGKTLLAFHAGEISHEHKINVSSFFFVYNTAR